MNIYDLFTLLLMLCCREVFAQEVESEQFPTFSECKQRTYAERLACTHAKMAQYVYSEITYPFRAWLHNIQGMVVVSFVVDERGRMMDIELKQAATDSADISQMSAEEIAARKEACEALNEEALRVVQKLAKISKKWTAGKINGKAVKIRYNLPIKFTIK